MRPHFVVTQTKQEYDREQLSTTIGVVKVVGWAIFSFFLSVGFRLFSSWNTVITAWIVFLVMFAVADVTKNVRLRSYIKTTLAVLYGFVGIIYIGFAFFRGIHAVIFWMIGLGIVFLWLSYKQLKKYPSFFRIVSETKFCMVKGAILLYTTLFCFGISFAKYRFIDALSYQSYGYFFINYVSSGVHDAIFWWFVIGSLSLVISAGLLITGSVHLVRKNQFRGYFNNHKTLKILLVCGVLILLFLWQMVHAYSHPLPPPPYNPSPFS